MHRLAAWLVVPLLIACGEKQASTGESETGETGGSPSCEVDDDCLFGRCVLGVCRSGREPYLDIWREELVLPAEQFERLVIGGTGVHENFRNRGDIEVRHGDGDDGLIVVEMQRFTVARNQADANAAFGRMKLWAHALEVPQRPDQTIAGLACEAGDVDFCHVRNYYEGQLQPARDGVNFRITLPAGWSGELVLETEDNIMEAEYPDRGDVTVDGLAGSLRAILDSGRAEIRLAEGYRHFPGCPLDDACLAANLAPDCGCSEFARIEVVARSGEAAEITVDVPSGNTYAAVLRSDDPLLERGCLVEVDCDDFGECDTVTEPALVHAAINHPGDPALLGAGIRVELHTGACAEIEYADQPKDWFDGPAVELRGNVRLCSGCP